MTTNAVAWAEGLRVPVDLFLDRVERGLLSAGVVRPVRGAVIGRLESEIVERVSRAGGESPKVTDVAAALEEFGTGKVESGGVVGEGDATSAQRRLARSLAARHRARRRSGRLPGRAHAHAQHGRPDIAPPRAPPRPAAAVNPRQLFPLALRRAPGATASRVSRAA